jgi:hypothetical protein
VAFRAGSHLRETVVIVLSSHSSSARSAGLRMTSEPRLSIGVITEASQPTMAPTVCLLGDSSCLSRVWLLHIATSCARTSRSVLEDATRSTVSAITRGRAEAPAAGTRPYHCGAVSRAVPCLPCRVAVWAVSSAARARVGGGHTSVTCRVLSVLSVVRAECTPLCLGPSLQHANSVLLNHRAGGPGLRHRRAVAARSLRACR